MIDAIGMLELRSIAKGIEAADAMVKNAPIEIIHANTICSGKYMIIIGGRVSDVRSAMSAGERIAEYSIIDRLIIPNIHEQIFSALSFTTPITILKALGTIECFTAAATIIASDLAVKAAKVDLIQIRLANGIGGKGYVTLTGDIGAVSSAVAVAAKKAKSDGLLVEAVVIPSPHEDLYRFIL